MGIIPLAKSLLYLFAAASGLEGSAFDCPPWTLPGWRDIFGLRPLEPTVDDPNGIVDVETVYASEGDGFVLSEAASAAVRRAKRGEFDDSTLSAATEFMELFWSLGRADAEVRRPIEYTIAAISRDFGGTRLPGFPQYRQLVLGMLNRPGGPLSVVEEIMNDLRATPAEQWKDDRDTNRKRQGLKRVDEYSVPLPTMTSVLESPQLKAAVATRLFGKGAVNRGGIVLPEYRTTTNALLQRKWESLHRKLKNGRERSHKQYTDVVNGINAAEEKRTAAALRQVSESMMKWRKTAQSTLEQDDAPFLDADKRLKELWESLGCVVEDQVMSKRSASLLAYPKNSLTGDPGRERPPARAKWLSEMPTDGEMEAAFEYYVENYCNALGAGAEVPIPTLGEGERYFELISKEEDIGVDETKNWSAEEIWTRLGLHGKTQFPFAEPGRAGDETLGVRARSRAEPQWHQLVGVYTMLKRCWTESKAERPVPTLLCDDVGLGKTFQIIALFSMLEHIYEQQQLPLTERKPLPPFLAEHGGLFFDGEQEMENLPSLLVLPRTLCDQWVDQWKRFTQLGAFVLVRYTVDQGCLEDFSTDPAGPYRAAAGPKLERAHKVVVVADISAIAKEAIRCLDLSNKPTKSRGSLLMEARGDPPKFKDQDKDGGPSTSVISKGSILRMRFRSMALDEAHNVRNCGNAQQGLLVIAENTSVVIGATATPLFTSPKDITALGRVLRYQPTLKTGGERLCEKVLDSMRDRRKEWDDNSGEIIEATARRESLTLARARGLSADNPQVAEIYDAMLGKYSSEDQRMLLEKAFVAHKAIELMRGVVHPIILRRTINSKDHNGESIMQLPPCSTRTVWSPLAAREEEAMARVNEHHIRLQQEVARKLGLNSTGILKWTNFLLGQKNVALHYLLEDLRLEEKKQKLKEGTLVNRLADDWDASNLRAKASTRLLKLDEVIDHYWEGNPKPPIYREDGTRDLVAEDLQDDPLPSEKLRKFLVYVAYRYHRDLIAAVFKIVGRGYTFYDGSMSVKKRQQAVDKFNEDDKCRIMIISNVGATGLNLSVASIVILVSGVWSGQEKWQIIGRALRYGQERDVVVLNIVAPTGIDLALVGYADSKTCLSDRFLMSEKKLREAYLQITAPEWDDGDELEVASNSQVTTARASKVASRSRKRTLAQSNDEEHTQDHAPGVPAAPSKPAKRAKKQVASAASTGKPCVKKTDLSKEAGASGVVRTFDESNDEEPAEAHIREAPTALSEPAKRAKQQVDGATCTGKPRANKTDQFKAAGTSGFEAETLVRGGPPAPLPGSSVPGGHSQGVALTAAQPSGSSGKRMQPKMRPVPAASLEDASGDLFDMSSRRPRKTTTPVSPDRQPEEITCHIHRASDLSGSQGAHLYSSSAASSPAPSLPPASSSPAPPSSVAALSSPPSSPPARFRGTAAPAPPHLIQGGGQPQPQPAALNRRAQVASSSRSAIERRSSPPVPKSSSSRIALAPAESQRHASSSLPTAVASLSLSQSSASQSGGSQPTQKRGGFRPPSAHRKATAQPAKVAASQQPAPHTVRLASSVSGRPKAGKHASNDS
ncbi:hypothetical protein FRC09_020876 [Ceratobasidium sp. 395]|nr:hypothetical protein FRC09_020876 [Ceratobasidium sp. 395]